MEIELHDMQFLIYLTKHSPIKQTKITFSTEYFSVYLLRYKPQFASLTGHLREQLPCRRTVKDSLALCSRMARSSPL